MLVNISVNFCICFQAVMLTVLASRAFKGLLSRFYSMTHCMQAAV